MRNRRQKPFWIRKLMLKIFRFYICIAVNIDLTKVLAVRKFEDFSGHGSFRLLSIESRSHLSDSYNISL